MMLFIFRPRFPRRAEDQNTFDPRYRPRAGTLREHCHARGASYLCQYLCRLASWSLDHIKLHMLILCEAGYDVDSRFCPPNFEASEILAVRVVTMSWHRLENFEPAPDLYQHCIASNTRIQNVQFGAN